MGVWGVAQPALGVHKRRPCLDLPLLSLVIHPWRPTAGEASMPHRVRPYQSQLHTSLSCFIHPTVFSSMHSHSLDNLGHTKQSSSWALCGGTLRVCVWAHRITLLQ